MTNHLDLPLDLAALIEKREGEDRRGSGSEISQADAPTNNQADAPAPVVERRGGKDRRQPSGS